MSGFNYASYLPLVRRMESNGNDNAQAKGSSAGGRYQFIDSTFLNQGRKLFPGLSDQQIMAKKMDPEAQELAMKSFTDGNIGVLSQAGIPINNANVYKAHHFGAGGAQKLLGADPNADVGSVLGADVVAANPYLRGMTVGQLQQRIASKTGEPSDVMAGGSVSPQMAGGGGMDTLQPPQDQGMLAGLVGPGDGQSWNAGDALIGAGVAAMARDNPAGAAALARNLGQTRDKRTQRAMQTQYDPKTGRLIKIDPATGRVEVQELGAPPPIEKEYTPEVIRKEAETFMTNDESLRRATSLAERTNYFREKIKSGEFPQDFMSQSEAQLRNYFNSSTEKSKLYADFQSYKEELRNFQLLAAKGVQTEGDATRAMNQFFPPGSTFDDKTVLTRLEVLGGSARKDAERLYTNNKDVLARTGKVKADGGAEWDRETSGKIKSLKDWEDNFKKPAEPPKSTGAPAAGQGPMFTSPKGVKVLREIK
jgi:hypothetical protein